MLMTVGKDILRKLISGKSTDAIVTMKLGTSNTAADAAQTALVAEVLSQSVSANLGPLSNQVTIQAIFQSDGASYKEVGLFTTLDVMVFRQVITPVTYTLDDLFIVTLTLSVS